MRHTVAENSDSPGPMDVSSSSEQDVGVADSDYTDENRSNVYNYINAPRFAAELVRAGVSLRAGAAIYNALLDDFKDANLLTPPPRKTYNDLRMDHSKIKRIIRNVSIISCDRGDNFERIECLGVDGRKDNETLIHKDVVIDGIKKIRTLKGKINNVCDHFNIFINRF